MVVNIKGSGIVDDSSNVSGAGVVIHGQVADNDTVDDTGDEEVQDDDLDHLVGLVQPFGNWKVFINEKDEPQKWFHLLDFMLSNLKTNTVGVKHVVKLSSQQWKNFLMTLGDRVWKENNKEQIHQKLMQAIQSQARQSIMDVAVHVLQHLRNEYDLPAAEQRKSLHFRVHNAIGMFGNLFVLPQKNQERFVKLS